MIITTSMDVTILIVRLLSVLNVTEVEQRLWKRLLRSCLDYKPLLLKVFFSITLLIESYPVHPNYGASLCTEPNPLSSEL